MANLAHVITSPDGSFEDWSETLPHLIGSDPQEMVESTRKWLAVIHPADRERFRDTAIAARVAGTRADVEYRITRKDGTFVHVRQVMEPIPGEPDTRGRVRWFNTIQDVTAQKQAEEKIRRLNRVHAVMTGINSLIVRVRDRQDLFNQSCGIAIREGGFQMAWIGLADRKGNCVKPVAWAGDVGSFFDVARMGLGASGPNYGIAGRVVNELKPVVMLDVRAHPQATITKACQARGINSFAALPLIVGGKAEGVFAMYASDAGFFDENEVRLLQQLAADVAFAIEHIEKVEHAEYLAAHDPLTGLANRKAFYERLELQADVASEQGRRFALVIIDIERFKRINDTLGRQLADDLLRSIADRIRVSVNEVRLARVGGDHFAVVSLDVGTVEEIARLNEQRLQEFFGSPFRVSGHELRVSARTGIAVFPDDGRDADTLFRNAEAALKKAKQSGERTLFYEKRMSDRVAEKLTLENKLRQALAKNEFVLHYQPKVDTENRRIVGLEALIRWNSPELGMVPPGKFIDILEETGLILPVGMWAMREAATQYRLWSEQGLNVPRIAVNVSPLQLRQRNFVELVAQALSHGVKNSGIDLEITESLVMDDIEGNIVKLSAVRDLGVEVAIDDFGTGYSSLAYLAKLPVHFLKIDRSFVVAMTDDPNAMTLVSTMITLAHSLGLKVTAEGVETEEQAKGLRLLRCDEMQGYLVSKPIPQDQSVVLLRQSH